MFGLNLPRTPDTLVGMRWMRDRYGPVAIMKSLIEVAPALAIELPGLLPHLPSAMTSAVTRLGELDRLVVEQRAVVRRLNTALDRRERAVTWRHFVGLVLIGAGAITAWRLLAPAMADGTFAFGGAAVLIAVGVWLATR